ncbi:endonuclease/exonuclease/phosphatase family protein [Sinorhizobium medicae]|uniref:endonuclease/exonuclease/phosphatase family protein n=1 Tax=Sinorhizobium medicae TaxID=110321 RepID=UPI001AED0FF3|nr:endonuclease/exonuclease/phosphatase family protein [Sinorhizobium medicae]
MLERLLPDIAIIPEASEDFAHGLPAASSLWIGTENRRGLGVLALNGWVLEHAKVEVEERLFLPCVAKRGQDRFQLVAVCVKLADYVSPTLAALQRLSDFLSGGPTILAGDFNASAALRRNRPFRFVPDQLAEMHMTSAWHQFRGEAFGKETAHTYYHQWKNGEGCTHIDYAFISWHFSVEAAEIGSYADYTANKLSDHAPLVVDLRLLLR